LFFAFDVGTCISGQDAVVRAFRTLDDNLDDFAMGILRVASCCPYCRKLVKLREVLRLSVAERIFDVCGYRIESVRG